jgi:hypothetical protein
MLGLLSYSKRRKVIKIRTALGQGIRLALPHALSSFERYTVARQLTALMDMIGEAKHRGVNSKL